MQEASAAKKVKRVSASGKRLRMTPAEDRKKWRASSVKPPSVSWWVGSSSREEFEQRRREQELRMSQQVLPGKLHQWGDGGS